MTELQHSTPDHPRAGEILTREAMDFVAGLDERFEGHRQALLSARVTRQQQFDSGVMPDFLATTAEIRSGNWSIGQIPHDLVNRTVEITGPVDRKMIINALNSGAQAFMADFEDSNSPTFDNTISGQINLMDAVRRTISLDQNGKSYRLTDDPAVLFVRPRGWHLDEMHVTTHQHPVSASLFDFGMFIFHNGAELMNRGSGPYFYLPKLESHLEARLWNDVFVFAQETLGIPLGTIKATVLIETLPAAFEMDEILYELRDHSAGLNAGRWDYIFSFIKKLRSNPAFVMPDRDQVTMSTPFMEAYTDLLVHTCHKRGAHAMGGMAAFIPDRSNPGVTETALAKVKADKEKEARKGHDGTWVAHPDLIEVAAKAFVEVLGHAPNQIDNPGPVGWITANDLLSMPAGTITEAGLRKNISVGIRYITSWIQGIGAAAIFNLMEDAATAEISRSQIWQWVRHGATMDDGRVVTEELVRSFTDEELAIIESELGKQNYDLQNVAGAAAVFLKVALSPNFEEFLTIPASDLLPRPSSPTNE